MKKRKLRELSRMAKEMPLDLHIGHRGVAEAHCRYRQMKKLYKSGGDEAVDKYYKEVMSNKDQLVERNEKIKAEMLNKIKAVNKARVEFAKEARKEILDQKKVLKKVIRKQSKSLISRIWDWIFK